MPPRTSRLLLLASILAALAAGAPGCRRTPTIHAPPPGGSQRDASVAGDAPVSRARASWEMIAAPAGAPAGDRDPARGSAVGRHLLALHPTRPWIASYDPCERRWQEHAGLTPERRRLPAIALDPTHAALCCGPPDRSGVILDVGAAAPRELPSMPQTPWPGRASEVVVDGLLVPIDKRFHLREGAWRVIPFDDAVYQASGQQGSAVASSGAHVIVFSGGRFEPGRGEVLAVGGAIFDAWKDRWRTLPSAGAPAPRRDALALWAGRDFLIYGGLGAASGGASPTPLSDGGRFDPATDRWRSVAPGPALRGPLGGVLAGDVVLVWDAERVGVYDLASDRWREVAMPARVPVQDRVAGHGRLAVVTADAAYLFDPERLRWSETPLPEALRGRHDRVQVMTSSHLVIWGGKRNTASGGCEDPPPDQGCDPWVETRGEADGAALRLGECR
ncbi:MAG: hypothetical protein H6710_23985 [Myxococcales bacterium]|nr:hypothetical protein [Myxococcales bacterium]